MSVPIAACFVFWSSVPYCNNVLSIKLNLNLIQLTCTRFHSKSSNFKWMTKLAFTLVWLQRAVCQNLTHKSCLSGSAAKFELCAAGKLLFSENFPSSLHCVTVDRWEGSLFLGGGDGRIFQVGMYPSEVKPSETQYNGQMPIMPDNVQILSGHTRCINSLACTLDSFHLVSG